MHCSICGFENPVSHKRCGKCSATLVIPVVSPERRAAVLRARDIWVGKLIDLSRRNKLLFFRDLKTGTLDLSKYDPKVLSDLLRGNSVSLASLLPGSDEVSTSARANEIRRTALANLEERGLETLFIAFGFATWLATDGGRPAESPILLVPIVLEKRGREGRALGMRLAGDLQINPVLLFSLEREHGRQVTTETLLEAKEATGEEPLTDPAVVYARLQKVAAGIKDFRISPRSVLGNFAYQKMAMVKDLRDNLEQLTQHDLVAAIAGDPSARRTLRTVNTEENPRELDLVPPNNEFLVLDADSTQQAAIAGVLSLKNGVIHGPPGTGKSQTIANLIVELAARGRRVLFVAEKRAALEVVLDRLERRGLRHLALDLHGAGITRRSVMRQFAESLTLVRDSTSIDLEELHRRFVDRRDRLNAHVKRMHQSRAPSRLSVYHLQGRLLHFSEDQRSEVRWRGVELERLTLSVMDEAYALLTELEGFSGLFLRTDPSKWTGAKLANGAAVQHTIDALRRLVNECWPELEKHLNAVIATSKAPSPNTLGGLSSLLGLLNGINKTLESFEPAIFEQDLEAIKIALNPAKSRLSAAWAWCFKPKFRRARRQVRDLRRNGERSSAKLLEAVSMALAQLRHWKALAPGQPPIITNNLAECRSALDRTTAELELLASILARGDLRSDPIDGLQLLCKELVADSLTPHRLPRLTQIEERLSTLGITALLNEIRKRRPDPLVWPKLLEHAWLASSLDAARNEDPNLAGFNGGVHQRFREEFCELDTERLNLSVQRVRRAHAEQALAAMNAHPDQEGLVRHEAARKARHLPFRKLVAQAPQVLTALRPCWFASPLSVSELMPAAQQYFDVVLFDEASQVLPEDAVPALLRASTAVVAGDQNQLPPTTFFDLSGEEDEEAESASAVEGFESLLDQMIGLIERPWSLDWHYRSLDESLIAFSNRHIYGDRLITFPGAGGPPALSHVLVPFIPDQDGQEESSGAEVRRVVELVLKHAVERPTETLGVIAMGIKHARRVEAALDQALLSRPDLQAFFEEDKSERFFVKNLERVQGDERDAIILTVGYGKDRTGRLLYRFGPLNAKGGERRLNVAITRARRRMTVVSSFDHRDMDPDRTKARGAELLRLYLEYAASRGRHLGDQGQLAFPENSFEANVHIALQSKGIELIPQYGASKYRIDFVAKHPKRPGRLVLAIECDGASYHSAYTARDRDRLRQQHLEALGWRFHRIWSTDWFMRRDQEIDRAIAAYRAAIVYADRSDFSGGGSSASSGGSGENGSNPASDASSASSVNSRRPPPPIRKRDSIDEYNPSELLSLAVWIESDGRLRTDQELAEEMFKTLGFKRRGVRIDDAIRKAIAQSHWRAKSAGSKARDS
jgi:very-short-patch-repair endonuclease